MRSNNIMANKIAAMNIFTSENIKKGRASEKRFVLKSSQTLSASTVSLNSEEKRLGNLTFCSLLTEINRMSLRFVEISFSALSGGKKVNDWRKNYQRPTCYNQFFANPQWLQAGKKKIITSPLETFIKNLFFNFISLFSGQHRSRKALTWSLRPWWSPSAWRSGTAWAFGAQARHACSWPHLQQTGAKGTGLTRSVSAGHTVRRGR